MFKTIRFLEKNLGWSFDDDFAQRYYVDFLGGYHLCGINLDGEHFVISDMSVREAWEIVEYILKNNIEYIIK